MKGGLHSNRWHFHRCWLNERKKEPGRKDQSKASRCRWRLFYFLKFLFIFLLWGGHWLLFYTSSSIHWALKSTKRRCPSSQKEREVGDSHLMVMTSSAPETLIAHWSIPFQSIVHISTGLIQWPVGYDSIDDSTDRWIRFNPIQCNERLQAAENGGRLKPGRKFNQSVN